MSRTFYDAESGRGLYSTSQNIEIPKYPDWVDGRYDMDEYYFPDGEPTLRAKMTPTITGNDPAVVDSVVAFTGFPDDAIVNVGGIDHQLDDGAINFTPTSPGVYNIYVLHPAHLNWGGTINAS